MARLFTVAISEANYNNTEQQIWALNHICSRMEFLTTVSHSVSDDTYTGYSGMIELLVQVLDASTINRYGPRYQEIRETLNALLAKYESPLSEEEVAHVRKSYVNKSDDFDIELAKIEESIDPDGDLEDQPVFHFFHRDGARGKKRRAYRLKELREKEANNKKEER